MRHFKSILYVEGILKICRKNIEINLFLAWFKVPGRVIEIVVTIHNVAHDMLQFCHTTNLIEYFLEVKIRR